MLLVRRMRLALLATARAGLSRAVATGATAAPPSTPSSGAHAPRLTPTPQQRTADQAFLRWCESKQILAPRVEIGHCRLGGVAQRGLYATADIAAGEPIVAVPHDAFVGRSTHHNKQLIALTDRIYPRGSPPLRPLTADDLVKESDPTLTQFAPSLQLAVLLTMEVALGAASPYRAWLDILPPLPADVLALTAPAGTGEAAEARALSDAAPPPAVMNAPFLEPQSVQRAFRAAAAAGRTGLRGAELRAMISDVARRVSAYHEFLADTLSTHAVLRAMIERVAKARFGGDTDAAISLFRWALSIVDSRANQSINNIEPDSPVMELDPYMHLDESGDGKEVRVPRAHGGANHVVCSAAVCSVTCCAKESLSYWRCFSSSHPVLFLLHPPPSRPSTRRSPRKRPAWRRATARWPASRCPSRTAARPSCAARSASCPRSSRTPRRAARARVCPT